MSGIGRDSVSIRVTVSSQVDLEPARARARVVRPHSSTWPALMLEGVGCFSEDVRAVLSTIYPADELAGLEHALKTPCQQLHVRVNLMRTSRSELSVLLKAALGGSGERWAISEHDVLSDVLVIQRQALRPEFITPFMETTRTSPDRFAERKRLGLPPHEVFVDRACAEAVLKGADIFVRGLRAASMGLQTGDRVAVYCDVRGVLLRGSACPSLDGMYFIGTGVCRMERSALFREGGGLGVSVEHTIAGDLPSLSGVLPQLLYVQSLPSLVVAHVLAAQPGERIIDLCAAPGSKTTHVASNFMRDTGTLVACERGSGKVAKMATLCATFGLQCVVPTRADTTHCVQLDDSQGAADVHSWPQLVSPVAAAGQTAAQQTAAQQTTADQTGGAHAPIRAAEGEAAVPQANASERGATNHGSVWRARQQQKKEYKEWQRRLQREKDERKLQRSLSSGAGAKDVDVATAAAATEVPPGARFPPNSFDRVLLDPPCSALGLRPKLRQDANSTTLQQASSYGRLFAWCAVRLLRPGGTLVYSTCTLTAEENEGFVMALLERHPCLRLVAAEPRVGGVGRPAGGMGSDQCALVQRFEPAAGCEGFFIAKFIKSADS